MKIRNAMIFIGAAVMTCLPNFGRSQPAAAQTLTWKVDKEGGVSTVGQGFDASRYELNQTTADGNSIVITKFPSGTYFDVTIIDKFNVVFSPKNDLTVALNGLEGAATLIAKGATPNKYGASKELKLAFNQHTGIFSVIEGEMLVNRDLESIDGGFIKAGAGGSVSEAPQVATRGEIETIFGTHDKSGKPKVVGYNVKAKGILSIRQGNIVINGSGTEYITGSKMALPSPGVIAQK
jgi:hypothetical protein